MGGRRRSCGPGLFSMRDHNFQKPESLFHVSEPCASRWAATTSSRSTTIPASSPNCMSSRMRGWEIFSPKAKRRSSGGCRAEETETKVFTGESAGALLSPGIDLSWRHFKGEYDDEYTLLSVHHHGVQSPGYRSDEEAPVPYRNSFRCIPLEDLYVPARTTPNPWCRVRKLPSWLAPPAKKSTSISTVALRFSFSGTAWARSTRRASCWVRVAQGWAGKQWGTIFNPRIGQEVVVGFLEGDPDQPLITGRVYNATEMPPYALPDNPTMSTIKSYSSKGGGGFNEIPLRGQEGRRAHLHARRTQPSHAHQEGQVPTGDGKESPDRGRRPHGTGQGRCEHHVKGDENVKSTAITF